MHFIHQKVYLFIYFSQLAEHYACICRLNVHIKYSAENKYHSSKLTVQLSRILHYSSICLPTKNKVENISKILFTVQIGFC